MTQLNISESQEEGIRVITLSGPVNSYTYTEFQDKLKIAFDLAGTVVVNMEKVTNLSSAGVGVLMASLDDAEDAGKKLFVMQPSEIAKQALDSTGFGDRFTIIESLHDAK